MMVLNKKLAVVVLGFAVVGSLACSNKKREEYVKSLKGNLPPSCSITPSETVLNIECDDAAGMDGLKSDLAGDCDKIKAAGFEMIALRDKGADKVYSAGGLDGPLGNCTLK